MEINANMNKFFDLKGKTALITGGGTGLGLIITQALVKSGAKVIIVSRKKTNLFKARDSILALNPKSSVSALVGDLGNETSIEKLVREVKNITNSVDILVNNSGVSWGAELGKFTSTN